MNHQANDGSWSFDLKRCYGCSDDLCSHPGSYPDRAGATAMALLACLSRGYTHRDGPYKEQIETGLAYLEARANYRNGILYQDGDRPLFVQGMATLALSECYSMTKDERLRQPAQQSINHVVATQDNATGGWPFRPSERCDTVATVVQLTALKSAQLAGLQVSPSAAKKAAKFLDSVQADNGSAYGSSSSQDVTDRSSAAGLLGRIYLGWQNDDPRMRRGEEQIQQKGASGDLFFDFLGSQVVHHMNSRPEGVERLRMWNPQIREMAERTMASQGHEAGSWFDSVNSDVLLDGGRLYCTALVAMTQQVYYRHLPIHQRGSFSASLLEEAAKATAQSVRPDPGTLTGFRELVGETLFFKAVGATAGGSVWGSNPYTGDSQLARAAVHAGVLKPGESGVVKVTILPGQKTYSGTTKNGVKTGRWGAFGLSYRIEDAITTNSLEGQVFLNGKPFLTNDKPVLSSLSYLDAERKQNKVNGAQFIYNAKTGRYRITGLPDKEQFLMWLFFQRNQTDEMHLGGQFLFSAYLLDFRGVALESRAEFPLQIEQVVHLRRPVDNGKVFREKACPTLESPVKFQWEEVVGADMYEVEVSTWWRPDHPPGDKAKPITQRTAETKVTFTLPPSKPQEYYRVAIKAFAGGKQIGDLMAVGEGWYGWWIDFVVQP